MFDITGDDIARLNDEDLRTLIGLLCEADVCKAGHARTCVTWGGNQTAPDGGLDVHVALPSPAVMAGSIPRSITGLQIKRQKMPRSKILAEISPNGIPRDVISELADAGGAYIIVSSLDSTAHRSLRDRQTAMREAVADMPNSAALALDFFDCGRIASWVRDHPGLIPWIRNQIGRPLQGWQSYGSWANPGEDVNTPYLNDNKLRIRTGRHGEEAGLSAVGGIAQMRAALARHGAAVRFIGLSGVGKTRLVQALFDNRIGTDSLAPSQAVYTNLAHDPAPPPPEVAAQWIAAGLRAIIVVDNCPGELHRHLAAQCANSTVSILTIEFDIRDDRPEGTAVFALEPSSVEVVEQLVRRRFPTVSEVDAHTIGDFSGGNARIAIAIAGTLGTNETLAGLTDDELFQRLFRQRNAHDPDLYRTAQACALVYSFQGNETGEQSGLVRLSTLVGQSGDAAYANIAELYRRDLVQQRDIWRAVLPQAIANRLAVVALQNIPQAKITKQLVTDAPARTLRSFSRRLSYLHDSPEAQAIVHQWLQPGGIAGALTSDDDGRVIIENIAPVAPDHVLALLEQQMNGMDDETIATIGPSYARLLRILAYDAQAFERCAALLTRTAAAGGKDELERNRRHPFGTLFQLWLSGTHATVTQRTAFARKLLTSTDHAYQHLGIEALSSLLEAWHISAAETYEFGARSRDYGYQPQTKQDVAEWFQTTLGLATVIACGTHPAAAVRVTMADKLRSLWNIGLVEDELIQACTAITKHSFWPEGWRALHQTLAYDGKGMSDDRRAKLEALIALLRPSDLIERIRAVVFTEHVGAFDLDPPTDPDDDSVYERAQQRAQELGELTGSDEATLAILLPELVRAKGWLWMFGKGLALTTPDPAALWKQLVAELEATPERQRQALVLSGALHGIHQHNSTLANRLLDEVVDHGFLASYYPWLQTAVELDHVAVTRLLRALDLGNAPIHAYHDLRGGRATSSLSPTDMKALVLRIAQVSDGPAIAIELFGARLHSDRRDYRVLPLAFVQAGRDLIRYLPLESTRELSYELETVVGDCLHGKDGATDARALCERLRVAISAGQTQSFRQDDLIGYVFAIQPLAALEGLCGSTVTELKEGIHILDHVSKHSPLDHVPTEDLLRWCDEQPTPRYAQIARVVSIFGPPSPGGDPSWSSLAQRLLDRAPNKQDVLAQFIGQFVPSGGWGSIADGLESNLMLLDALTFPNDPALMTFIALQRAQLVQSVEEYRRRDIDWNRHTGFE